MMKITVKNNIDTVYAKFVNSIRMGLIYGRIVAIFKNASKNTNKILLELYQSIVW